MRQAFDLSLYLVTDPKLCRQGVVATCVAAVSGGVRLVQLRDKTASDAELIALGKELKAALASTPARLIVNDRIAVAKAVGADGLHVGQGDVDPRAARERLGDSAIIGLSVECADMARRADRGVIDYLGAGPVFATATKADHASPLGFEGLAAICTASPGLPVVAIGGLGAAHAASVIAAGAQGLAVVSALCDTQQPQTAARRLLAQIEQAKRNPSPDAPFVGTSLRKR